MPNYICFDFETGGLDFKKNPVCEIGLIVYDENFKELFRFESFIKNYKNLIYDPVAMNIHKITTQEIDSGVSINELTDILIEIFTSFVDGKGKWKKKPILVGHNIADFDVEFLNYIFELCDKKLFDYVSRQVIDTVILARERWKGKYTKFNLAACLGYIGEEVTDAHRAINDVEPNIKLHQFLFNSFKESGEKHHSNVENVDQQSSLRNSFKF